MVIGYCGKVPRNTGLDPDAIAQTWRDRVHLQAHGSAAAEARRLAAGADRDSRDVRIADDDHQAAASSLI